MSCNSICPSSTQLTCFLFINVQPKEDGSQENQIFKPEKDELDSEKDKNPQQGRRKSENDKKENEFEKEDGNLLISKAEKGPYFECLFTSHQQVVFALLVSSLL